MPSVLCQNLGLTAWEPAPAAIALNGDVHIWMLRIGDNIHNVGMAASLLDHAEQFRAGKYVAERDRTRFILSRAMLRLLLAKYTGERPGEIKFSVGANKKPCLGDNHDIQYNVTHSGDIILIAVSETSVGIDVEQLDTPFDYCDIIDASFSKEEANYISQHGGEGFYRCWTRKEALLKATGQGIDDDMQLIPCLDGLHQLPARIAGSCNDWVSSSIDVAPGYTGCITHSADKGEIAFYTLPDLAALEQ